MKIKTPFVSLYLNQSLINSKISPIRSYSLTSIIGAAPGSTVNYTFQSKQGFYLYYESAFLVIQEGKTIVGPILTGNYSCTTLVSEDVTQGKSTQIGTHLDNINTLMYDKASKTLFAGDESGNIIQYQKNEDSTSFSQLKNYGNVGVGKVYSSILVDSVAIFGGSNKTIVAIDTKTQEKLTGSLATAISNIYSLTSYKVSKTKTLLSISGNQPNYSDTHTDIFELHFHSEPRDQESQINTSTESIYHKTTTFPTANNHQVVDTIVSSLQKYLKGLFSDFTRVYLDKLRDLQSKY